MINKRDPNMNGWKENKITSWESQETQKGVVGDGASLRRNLIFLYLLPSKGT